MAEFLSNVAGRTGKTVAALAITMMSLLCGAGCSEAAPEAKQWPQPPKIISQTALARNGFAAAPEAQADYALADENSCPAPLRGFEKQDGWRASTPRLETRIVNGQTVGAPGQLLKVGPLDGSRGGKCAARLMLDFPVPETYDKLTLSARAKEYGLRLAVGLLYDRMALTPDMRGAGSGEFVVYESAPVDVPVNWKHGLTFNLRQLDQWRIEGETVYSRNLPPLPVRGIEIILYGCDAHNSAVIDRIAFQ